MASFDSLSAHHSAQAPDHKLPKVGETRCCQYPYYLLFCTIDRSLFIYPRLFCSFERFVNSSADPFPFSPTAQIGHCFQQTCASSISTLSCPTIWSIKRTF
jgi:hypothetical protein